MTAPQQAPSVVVPERDSRLDQLAARFDHLKATAEETAAELKAVKDAIKTELAERAGDDGEAVLRSPHLAEPLRLHPVTSWRIDAKGLKAADPETYVRWAQQSTAWRLDPVK